ncbi:methyltransferase domain-containing protein [Caulobacter sp. SLTY]|uniref:SAM-dependent methyltransferase n=1 Tax=Caulobacter sp. SLTY TaxID=2683262 RepID=UPI001411B7D1|nr:cyclopropane-fatty-acyl-phospholipid synthase family protein [Caulobacter sp. SLTY]NBB14946.1 methyltransferase domain-containing protein [Caulobacter sp. SLTY]
MDLLKTAINAAESLPAPDALRRAAITWLVEKQRLDLLGLPDTLPSQFAADMRTRPIAEHTGAANDQHYEVPAEFFKIVLGPRLKYSSCLYDEGARTLAQAEDRALTVTCEHARLEDGQDILELGCGWGSLSLWMAARYPNARITSVSNSQSQRAHIEAQAAARGYNNLTVITADANAFQPEGQFDRVVSVEMFEHMANWGRLLERVRDWLKPEGRLFIHIFSHRTQPYRFSHEDQDDWIGKYFFTGGFMPSHDLIRDFSDLFEVVEDWKWNGGHYERTALDWLANMDREDLAVRRIMKATYGDQAGVWRRRWRLFFLATAGLFGHRDGQEWGVSHYLLRPVR